jgi:hypothetical protein
LKRVILISTWFLLFSIVNLSWVPASEIKNSEHIYPALADSTYKSVEVEAAALYNELSLQEKGLSEDAFEYAYKGYRNLLDRQLVKNPGYLTICDFSQSSNNKRFYLIDLNNNELLINTYVAHGRNSGGEFATKFSNKPSSLQSSLGFYITENTYFGEHGLSLKINGMEPGFNNNALKRAVVVHGADYIGENWLNSSDYMGRSYGCPAIPAKDRDQVINTIKNGTCLFIYHPSATYLKGSKILNA